MEAQNLFSLMGSEYYRLAFAQNVWADILLYQFAGAVEQHIPVGAFSLIDDTFYNGIFQRDVLRGFRGTEDFYFEEIEYSGSMFLAFIDRALVTARERILSKKFKDRYPRGLPNLGKYNIYFTFEPVVDGIMDFLEAAPTPLLAYLHFFPPHDPYFPTKEFIGIFDDDLQFPEKKALHFGGGERQERLPRFRREYDEYVAFTDDQFGRILDFLQESGLMDNSTVVVTSDHGELFERGVRGHVTQLLYEGLIHVPLLISSPGQQTRQDIYSLTSMTDLLPTILHLSGKPIPEGVDGLVLPGLGGQDDPQRKVLAIDAKQNPSYGGFWVGTAAMIQGDYKLIAYRGYLNLPEAYELYDLRNDPEELQDLYPSHGSLAAELIANLDQELTRLGKNSE